MPIAWPRLIPRLMCAACWLLLLPGSASAQRADTTPPERAFDISGASYRRGNAQAAAPRRDSVLDGLLIGAGVGALAGLIPDHYDDCAECHDALYASIGVGAGIGVLIDALRTKSSAASPSRRHVALWVGGGTRAARLRVAGTLRWK